MVRASDCQCTSCNGPGFDPSIRGHSGNLGAADEAVLNTVRKKKKIPPKIFIKKYDKINRTKNKRNVYNHIRQAPLKKNINKYINV